MPDLCDYSRRCDLSRCTPAERAIHAAMAMVESMPADVRLTDAASLLQAAKNRVADYVDSVPGHRTHPMQMTTAAPTIEALKAAVELEVENAIGRVTTAAIGRLIDKVADERVRLALAASTRNVDAPAAAEAPL